MEEKIAKTSIYLTILLLPIFFLPFTQNVLDFQKQILLLFLISVSLFSFIVKILLDGKANLNFHFFNLLILISLLIFGLSVIFSKSKTESFFGFPLTVSEAFLTFLLLILTFWLIINLFEKKEIFYLLLFFSISIFLVEIITLLQIFQKYIFPFDFTKNPSFNTFGSLSSLAVFLACLLPMFLILFSMSKRAIKTFFFFQILLTLLLLIFINSKTALILTIFGLILILVFWVVQREIFSKNILIFSLFILTLSIVFLFFNFKLPLQLPAEVSLSQRLSLKLALDSIKENPIFGTGPATFGYNFLKFKGTLLNETIFWNFRFSNSASKFLDTLATTGILGTLAFLLFLFSPIYFGFYQIFKSKLEKLDLVLFFAIFFSVLTISLSFFLCFPPLTFSFAYFLFLASLFTLISEKKKEVLLERGRIFTLVLTFLLILFLVFDCALLIVNAQRYLAEVFYLKGIKNWQKGDIEKTIENINRAVAVYPLIDFYYRDLSQVYLAKANEKIQKGEDIQTEITNSINFANTATNLNPANVANWSVRAFTLENLIGLVGEADNWAIKCYDEAIKLEPANPYFFTRKGVVFLRKGIYSQKEEEKEEFLLKAEENFKKAIELKSDFAPAHFQLAILWQIEGKIDEAILKLEETKKLAPFDVGLAFQLGVTYYQKGDYQKAKEELERAIFLSPNYANALYFLGLTYDQLGEKEKALEKFRQVSQLNPEVEEVKKIISNLERGQKALEGIVPSVPPQTPIQEQPPEIRQ